jgi:hypothetical protein
VSEFERREDEKWDLGIRKSIVVPHRGSINHSHLFLLPNNEDPSSYRIIEMK